MLNQNKIKICIIIFIFILIINYEYYNIIFESITLNQNNPDLQFIIKIVKKFLDSNNAVILNKEEELIAKYWNYPSLCPFSKLMSHGLTKEEALLLIDFFNIESMEDLSKLEKFNNNNN